MLASAAFAVGQ